MLEDTIAAIIKTGIPVFALSVAVLYWINHRTQGLQRKSAEDGDRTVSKATQTNSETHDNKKDHKTDFLHNKWVQFGGGFYGMLGLLTYLIVEWNELIDLLGNLNKFELTVGNIISELIIKFLVESLINLITALTWPIYWLGKLGDTSVWMAFVAAYLGYWAAEKLVKFWIAPKFNN